MHTGLTGDEFSPDKIDASAVQRIAGQLAQILDSTSEILKICHAGLPRSPQLEQVHEGSFPSDLSSTLRGDIEVLVNETLPDASRILRKMESGGKAADLAD